MARAKRAVSSYKQFVNEAKQRLVANDYRELCEINRVGINNKAYLVNSRIVSGEELYGYYKKIVELMFAGIEYGALGRLIDEELYASLTDAERERYVLAISRLYRDLKEEYIKQSQKSLLN
ncbi:MAG: hypothetical protein WC292_03890 [Clostridia bacterium]